MFNGCREILDFIGFLWDSGTVEWGESAKIYTPLFAIVYASFFKYIKLPDEVIKSTLLQIF